MRKYELLLSYWLPPVFLIWIIFYASFQPASDQDITPVLRKLTDREFLMDQSREFYGIIRGLGEVARVLVVDNVLITIILGTALLVFAVFFVKATFDSGRDTRDRVLRLILLTVFLMILISSMVVLFATDEVAVMVSAFGVGDHAVSFLNWVDFHYAGRHVNMENYGAEQLLNFLFRKTAHFVLYALLAFFLFRAFFVHHGKKTFSFVIAIVVVIVTGSLDEFQQSFNPGRSGLVEDVVLDTVGGVFGASVAVLLSPLMKRRSRE